jgi:hypothetical protein
MPRVFIDAPTITHAPHRYQGGHICYLHPSMWNPGAHHLTFVIARAAKWLNKYEVWRNNGGTKWPGAAQAWRSRGLHCFRRAGTKAQS